VVTSTAGIDTLSSIENVALLDGTIGVTRGGLIRANTFTTDSQNGGSIASLPGGGYVVTWSSNSQDGSGYGVYAQRFDATGNAAGMEFRVNSTVSGHQFAEGITALGNGGFVVVWKHYGEDGNYGVYAQRYDATGNPVGSQTSVSSSAYGVDNITVSALGNAGFAVSWDYYNGSAYQLMSQHYGDSGSPLGGPSQVNTTALNNTFSSAAELASLANGGYVAAYTAGGGNQSVYVQRYNADGSKAGTEIRVTPPDSYSKHNPEIAGLSDGGFVVAWQGLYGNIIEAQRYDASGVAVGSTFRDAEWAKLQCGCRCHRASGRRLHH
jgi:hypothetical protein